MYPAYQGAGGAGLLANIHRTGFGSCSRVLHFFSGSSEVYYYVGNTRDVRAGFSATPTNYGTIECAVGGLSHFMAPVTTPAAAQVNAVDLAYYKGFLLYMAGGSISWSVAGFPTGGTAGFSTGDFPDLNTTVVDTQDVGLAFEFLGDQLIALFQNGAWLVQATGIVPEFNFYRLPEVPGIYAPVPAVASPDSVGIGPGGAGLAFGRHATRSAGSVFYLSEQGLAVIEGSPPHKIISEAVDNYDFPSETMPNRASSYWLSWDQGSDSLIWRDSSDGRGLMRRNGNWAQLDQTAIGAIRATTAADATGYLTASGTFGRGVAYRPMGVMYWNPSDQKVYHVGQLDAETTNTSAIPWIWASQIQSLGQVYNGFRVGGFEIWCRAAAGVTTANLQWSIYGGSDPYHLNLRQGPTTFNYAAGLVDGRAKLGNTLDDAFVGLVLTGSQWIELAGAVIYPSDSEAV
jgi:hypothetical protein